MIILDIDQDFFFHPVVNGSAEEAKEQMKSYYGQSMVEGFDEIIDKFIKYISPNTESLKFDCHDGVGELIVQRNLNDITLYHLDAHIDVGPLGDGMNAGNWISHIEDRCKEIYWVVNKKQFETTIVSGDIYNAGNVPLPDQKIDLITWTFSPEWCPQRRDISAIFWKQLREKYELLQR